MLSVTEAIRERRSIRSFKPDPVPQEMIREMLEAARLAPSGANRQPWRFLVVTDPEDRKRIRSISMDQKFLEEAPVVIVCCADLSAYSNASRKKRGQEFIDFGIVDTLSGRLADRAYWIFREDEPEPDLNTFLGAAMANAYIAIEHLVLTATALGLGTCWVGATGSRDEIRELFGLPESIVVLTLVPVGYPTMVPPPRPRLSLEEILLKASQPVATNR